MNNHTQPTLFRALLICAASAAQFWFVPAHAAVPIEESVGESRTQTGSSANEPVQSATRDGARSLDIPLTIEPTSNSDYLDADTGTQYRPLPRVVAQPVGVAPNVSNSAAAANSGGQLSQLFYQLQVLQQEIQDLRGQVEEQTYLVNRLQRDQKEQYLDLDRRLVAYSENQPAPGPISNPVANAPITATGGSLSERQAYTQAFEAMKARQFDDSMVGFQRLIETYPNGQFTPNAYYWIGELHLVAKDNAEMARQSFMQVVSLYPDHQKAPDALYKLGVVYHSLGDVSSALNYLGRVQEQHPASAAAGLAAKYAAELQ